MSKYGVFSGPHLDIFHAVAAVCTENDHITPHSYPYCVFDSKFSKLYSQIAKSTCKNDREH